MACVYLMQEEQQKTSKIKMLHQITAEVLLPQSVSLFLILAYLTLPSSPPHLTSLCGRYEQILLEPDPLPSYALKLLNALLKQNSGYIRSVFN